jgi:hypothetical protein
MLTARNVRCCRAPRRNSVIACQKGGQITQGRLLEIAAGRVSFFGLLGASVMGNTTGTSILTQYHHEEPIVWAIVGTVAGLTLLNGVNEVQVKSETWPARGSMLVITALIVAELALTR